VSEEIDEQPELTAISSLVFWDYERKWKEIADYVRGGCTDPQFLFVLQRTINPCEPFRDMLLTVTRRPGRPQIMDRGADTHVLVRLLYDKSREDRGLELIANEIAQNGLKDERLRNDLAGMFSRTAEGPLGMKFDVGRANRGKPPRAKKLLAQNFLELHSDIFGEKTTEVVAVASRIYGLDEETARKYLQLRRGTRGRDLFWSIEFERQVAYVMRERGYPDYQTLKAILENTELYPLPD